MVASHRTQNDQAVTNFSYRCEKCGNADFWLIDKGVMNCPHCSKFYALSENNVIIFETQKNEQNEHFNKLYSSGYSPSEDKIISEYKTEYLSSKNRVKDLLKLWKLDKKMPIVSKSFLDVACGPGWLTAGLMQNHKIRNCKFHAFDVAVTGLEMLVEYSKDLKTSHQLELSVQNAEKMIFDDNSFDYIIGHSMLHHLPEYEVFLNDCFRILKPGGTALFGEPFAMGYGLLAASLKLAQNDLDLRNQEIDALYDNIKFRVTKPRKQLKNFVDKHLFFQSEISALAHQIGFRSVDFISYLDRDYYRNQFVTDELRLSYKITDESIKERANVVYKTFFDLFDSDRFTHAISAFMYIILRN